MGTLERRASEKDRRRREILKAAIRCFGRKGYDDTTLDEVGREAEVAKGTLYLYFPSKADLFGTLLLEHGFDVFAIQLEAALEEAEDAPAALRAFVRTFQERCLDGPREIFQFFVQLDRGDIARDLSGDLRTEIQRRLDGLLGRLAELVDRGRVAGQLEAAEGARVAQVLWAHCIGVAHLSKAGACTESSFDPAAALAEGTDIILRGLRPER
jgi:AcrR family transcriptional regulator